MTQFLWQKPIFILGNPRSGTSLLRLMLDSHSNICIPPESHFFLWLENKYGEWNNLLLDNYIEDLFNSTKFETWNINKDNLKLFLTDKNVLDYSHLNSLIYYFYSLKTNNDIVYWGDKNSLWKEKLYKIKEYYPDAYYIYIIRDGRDVACSYKNLHKREIKSKYAPKLPQDISVIANSWVNNNNYVENYLKLINSKNIVQIKYEDLIKEPKKTLVSVLNMLKLDYMDKQLKYYKRPKNDIEPELFFDWKEKLMQPPLTSNIGKYKKELSSNEIELFNNLAKEVLEKYSYI
ncbi:MAG: hypothetical protein COA67_00585 [Lutibacter sp.]|nr:MAG: hypothetical protein COA67_00585 [Lutibacter sp.]